MMVTFLQLVQILSAIAVIGFILIQHGKGADMGAAFGSGSSGSLFGATGSANFQSRTTAVLITVFLVSTLALAYVGHRPAAKVEQKSTLEEVLQQRDASTVAPVIKPNAPVSTVPSATEANVEKNKTSAVTESSKQVNTVPSVTVPKPEVKTSTPAKSKVKDDTVKTK